MSRHRAPGATWGWPSVPVTLALVLVAGLATMAAALAVATAVPARVPSTGVITAQSGAAPVVPRSQKPVGQVASNRPSARLRPVSVSIPAIGVRSRLVALHMDAAGHLLAPPDWDVAGWYTGGAVPGELGPAVIAGHVDSHEGPAVFYRLRHLKISDRVDVARSDGSSARFRVVRVARYPKGEFPTADVYGPAPGPVLRLITCGGVFDRADGHYEDNVVVYAVGVV